MLNYILGKNLALYVKRHRLLVMCSIVLTAISSLFLVVPAYLIKPFVDEGMKLGTDPVSWKIPWIAFDGGSWLSWHQTEHVLVDNISPNRLLLLLTGVAVVSTILKSITSYFGELAAAAFSNRAVLSLRVDVFKKFISLPLGFHQKRKSGELIARATADLSVVQSSIVTILIGLIQHPLSAVVFLVYLLVMDYKLTLIVFFAGPVILGVIRLFGRKVKKHSVRVQDATADVTSAYQETLLCLKVVHEFSKGGYEANKFKNLAQTLYKRAMRWNYWNLGTTPILDVTVFLFMPVILVVGKMHYHHSLGDIMSMVYAFSRVYAPVKKLAKINNRLRTLQGATKRVFRIMNTVPAIREKPDAIVLPTHKDSIEFKNVSFGYEPDEPVLKNISFRVKAGETIAFVGSTGAGKSTILDLVPRFYDVTDGSISIDGIDIRDVTLDSLRKQIGIVNQDTLLFHDTIANNISYGKPDATSEEIEAVARAANAHNFIMAQPKGYDTVIGDQGTLLSGGQRQRIAIARALIIDPAILILDEAASALDAESETLIQKSIEKLHGTRTILIVAHRLSTIIQANHIYVIESGEIVEFGTLNELMALGGRFRELYDMQYRNAG